MPSEAADPPAGVPSPLRSRVDRPSAPAFLSLPTLQLDCTFSSEAFVKVALHHVTLHHPKATADHLFRADVPYDSDAPPASANGETGSNAFPPAELHRVLVEGSTYRGAFLGFAVHRTLVRRLTPRNPQFDRPVVQTCHVLRSTDEGEPQSTQRTLVVLLPHASGVRALPWYYPPARAVAFLHTWSPASPAAPGATTSRGGGTLALHLRLFPDQPRKPVPEALRSTAHGLLGAVHMRAELEAQPPPTLLPVLLPKGSSPVKGSSANPRHGLIVRHLPRLHAAYVGPDDPAAHVVAAIDTAAWLMQLWRELYELPVTVKKWQVAGNDGRPPFPGFVELGCGHGILTDILLSEGFPGWGLDARRRTTWKRLPPDTQALLREAIVVPQPLLDLADDQKRNITANPSKDAAPTDTSSPPSRLARAISGVKRKNRFFIPSDAEQAFNILPAAPEQHNGVFPRGTFIISNKADELTAWTPLLAALSGSAFALVPCCAHNLSGMRFRAPSAANSQTACTLAPTYFDALKARPGASKSVPITALIPTGPDDVFADAHAARKPLAPIGGSQLNARAAPETGDLKTLAASARALQPSAQAHLGDWLVHLSEEIGFTVRQERIVAAGAKKERVGITGWLPQEPEPNGQREGKQKQDEGNKRRRRKVMAVVRREGADLEVWMRRSTEGLKEAEDVAGHG